MQEYVCYRFYFSHDVKYFEIVFLVLKRDFFHNARKVVKLLK